MSIDSFSDVNCRSFFNIIAGCPLPFVNHTFRLKVRQQTPEIFDVGVSEATTEASDVLQKRVFAFCSDPPNVMTRARKLTSREIDGKPNCVRFAYGRACHALSNPVKDLCQVTFIKDTLRCPRRSSRRSFLGTRM